VLGPMVMRVATFFPFQTTYSFLQREIVRWGPKWYAQTTSRRTGNAGRSTHTLTMVV